MTVQVIFRVISRVNGKQDGVYCWYAEEGDYQAYANTREQAIRELREFQSDPELASILETLKV